MPTPPCAMGRLMGPQCPQNTSWHVNCVVESYYEFKYGSSMLKTQDIWLPLDRRCVRLLILANIDKGVKQVSRKWRLSKKRNSQHFENLYRRSHLFTTACILEEKTTGMCSMKQNKQTRRVRDCITGNAFRQNISVSESYKVSLFYFLSDKNEKRFIAAGLN